LVRGARSPDVAAIVAVHRMAFAGFFLTSLGRRFLADLYRGYLEHPSGILLVEDDSTGSDRTIRGFVAGTTEPEAFYRWLRRSSGLHMAFAAAPALVRHPLTVGQRMASALRYRGDSSRRVTGAALLASLAVRPDAAGGGTGGRLVDAFLDRAASGGCQSTYLSTDAEHNDTVLRFYERKGFRQVARLHRSGGREMTLLSIELGDRSAGTSVEPG
jgi:GNAT superfamily N-acetyltransferase